MKRHKVIAIVFVTFCLTVLWVVSHYSNRRPVNESRFLSPLYKQSPMNKKSPLSEHEFLKFGAAVSSIKNEMRALKIPIYEDELIPVKSGNNGADDLKMAFEIMIQSKPGSALRDLLDNYKKLDKEKIAELLESGDVREVLELAQKAVDKDFIDFGTDYSNGPATLLPELGPLRNLVKLISLNSKALVDSGDISKAVESLNLGITLNSMANDNVTLISGLVEVAGAKILEENLLALRTAGAELSRTSELLTRELNTSLNDQLKSLDGERILLGDWMFEKLLNKSDEKSTQKVFALLGSELEADFKTMTKSDIQGQYEEYLKVMLDMRILMEEPYYVNSIKFKQLMEDDRKSTLLGILLPSLSSVYKKYNESQSSMKKNILAIKLDEFEKSNGYLPASLSELNVPGDYLIDNMTGKKFTFVKKVGINYIAD